MCYNRPYVLSAGKMQSSFCVDKSAIDCGHSEFCSEMEVINLCR
jgi:hypothetical protein